MGASKFPNEQNSKLVDENGLPINATNPLDTTLANVAVSPTGSMSVIVENNSSNPVSATLTNSSIPVTGAVTAKIDATDNTVKLSTSANTIKIDQATAGANHIELRDATNLNHVAKVDSNGSVNTKVTNDTAGAIPTKITDGIYTALVTPGGALGVSAVGNVTVVNAASNSLNIKSVGTDTVTVTGSVGITGTPAVTLSGLNNNVKIGDGINTAGITGASVNSHITNEPRVLNQVRISGTTWVDDRRADRYQQSEWNGLGNNGSFSIYNAQTGIFKIRVTQMIVTVTNPGIYAFVFDNGSGTTTMFLKTRLPANTPHTLTFSNGILSPYTGGSIRLFNNTGGNSDVNTTVQAWEE